MKRMKNVYGKTVAYCKRKKAVVAGLIGALAVPATSFALSWPPTAAEVSTEFTAVGDTVGSMYGVAITVALTIFAGVIGISQAITFFGKMLRKSQSAA